jgi:Protein of unknown function (DUF1769)
MADTPSSSSSEPPAEPSKFRLRVTAGPAYDSATHFLVTPNADSSYSIDNEHINLSLAVRIQKFTGLPDGAPDTSKYFEHSLHTYDQYSIAFSFIPKVDIPGNDLVFGNDFDRPIRDRLPPGFGQAFKIVKWWVDPGLEGDVYSDKPYLYGHALSSWNILRVGEKIVDEARHDINADYKVPEAEEFHDVVVEEGADGTGEEVRKELNIPADSAGRKKHFLTQANREVFAFEKGRLYQSDFGNPYLDFNDFSLKLPGFSLNVVKYIDAKTHELRYTLKNKNTDEVYCVIMFTLLWGEELEEEKKKEGANGGSDSDDGGNFEDADEIPPDDDDVD